MNLVTKYSSYDKFIWRYHTRSPEYDIKINIRTGSVLEGFLIKIPILYFILFFCRCENISINNAFNKTKYFCMQIWEVGVDKESLSKFYRAVRSRLRENIYSK